MDADADGLAETAAAARKAGSRAEVLAADVTDLEAVTAAVGRAGGSYSRPRSRALITASSRDSAPSLR